MNKKQARRIALAYEGSFLVGSGMDSSEGLTKNLSQADHDRISEEQQKLGYQLLKRAGFTSPMEEQEIIDAVLAK